MSSDFVHLHVHSEYSLLDGLGRTADLAKEAVRLGQPALALTDHGVMHGVIEFSRNCKKYGVKPIIGVEGYITLHGRSMTGRDPNADKTRHHLLLLAQNMAGYKNLLKICSDAQLEGYYYRPRIDADYLAAHADGLICTTGCMAAEIPWLLNSTEGRPPQEEKALERLQWYLEVFGRERFFIELQEHSIPELTRINRTLFDWSKKFNIDLLVTNDVHYVTAQEAKPHDTLLCVQTSSLVRQPNRMRMTDNSYYLKSLEEMKAAFRPLVNLPESAFTNSLKIAEMCAVDLEDDNYHLPDLPPDTLPEGHTYETFLRCLTDEGLKRLYEDRANDPEIQTRKEHELKIIHRMGFDVYYLIVWDLCQYAHRRNIWWNVRGSGAGSIVAYAIGITLIDPLKHNLIFERFLNPGRVSMPDFDLDYPDDQREEMIRYTINRYGDDRVAQIVAFGRMKARAAIRDVGRAMDVPLSEVDMLAKQISAIPGKPATIADALDPEHEFFAPELKAQYDNVDYVHELVDSARNLEGVARHASVHAAAVIITDKPLTEYVPVMRPQGSVITRSVTQFEFPICDSIGLLKIDFLGLSTLTIMRKAAELIKERHGLEFNLANIPMDNLEAFKNLPHLPPPEKAFDLLASGNVTGVFQVEGSGMRRVLTEMKPTKFEHIVAAISLFRPGPMEYIPTYIKRMHGEEAVEYKHPLLEQILGDTYGIIVYQEQIIQIASQLAGYAPGDADQIRKAVGKKIKAKIDEHRAKFIKGAVNNGIDKPVAEAIYGDIEFFARYGFNKAHAADYALVTCQTAYLKAHFPIEYMTALLTVERHNTEKIGMLVGECRTMGLEVLPPDINYSFNEFVIEDRAGQSPAIRFGLGAIKNVGDGPIQVILDARAAEGEFADLDDFCSQVDLRQVGRRALECLIKVGALPKHFASRPTLLAIIDRMINLSSSTHKAADAGQLSMFDLGSFEATRTGSILYPPPEVEQVSQKEILSWEKELAGTYLSDHPLQKYLPAIQASKATMLGELDETMHGQQVAVAGMINFVRPHQTKKGEPMAFVEIEDIQTSREVVVFPRTYREYKTLLVSGNLILVHGKVDAQNGSPKILADTITNEITSYAAAGENQARPAQPAQSKINGSARPGQAKLVEANGQYEAIQPVAAFQEIAPAVETGDAPHWLHVTIPRANNLSQDKHRLRRVYDLLAQNPGNDHFSLYIPGGNKTTRVDFPNQTIKDSAYLRQQLIDLLGAGTVRVD
ncbi:MAG: DNA polymerase III subunit alpha [Anaerolineae bacterium]|nr:DNA polymerase III subunit alpha [Anaerolineae bacterium]